jgi:hypothetical protein
VWGEISWAAGEMRLHLGSFREIGVNRDRECGGGNQLGNRGDEVGSFGEIKKVRDRKCRGGNQLGSSGNKEYEN